MDAPLEGPINLRVRSGSILPSQEPNTVPPITTANSRGNPFGLTVALDGAGRAEGLVYFDDGESLDAIEADGSATVAFREHGDHLPGAGIEGWVVVLVKAQG
jgi:alpha-glucosidase (family GH31 glycosyl hydrolase)